MKFTVTLIRGGKTQSALEGKQLGMADEPLLLDERVRLYSRVESGSYPSATIVFVSPLLRCRDTATLIYPRIPAIIANDLRAFDSGVFEGMTYGEIHSSPLFLEWAQNDKLTACPHGENLYQLTVRSVKAFRDLTREMGSKGIESGAIITHNLVVSSIMQRFCIPRSMYRNWDTAWGGGFLIEYDTDLHTAKLVSSF